MISAVGQAFALDGRDACTKAIHEALIILERRPLSIAFIFASHEYEIEDVLSAATAQLGNTPLIGYSTSGELTRDGINKRSVTIALISGEDIKVKSEWIPGFSKDSSKATKTLMQTLGFEDFNEDNLFLVANGLNGNGQELCDNLPLGNYTPMGCLAGGDLRLGRTFQIGGGQAGSEGLAAALLSRNLKMSIGVAHGWQPIGASFEITMASDSLIRSLDGRPASESYAQLFGHQSREWGFPPLNTLVRLYPLGLSGENGAPIQVVTPIRVEADGSLLMNTTVKEGEIAHLMIGSQERCLESAREATRMALNDFGDVSPRLALVLPDISWQMLLEGQPGNEIQAVQEILGKKVPIAGGYTFGQIVQPKDNEKVQFLNQHIQVILFGDNK